MEADDVTPNDRLLRLSCFTSNSPVVGNHLTYVVLNKRSSNNVLDSCLQLFPGLRSSEQSGSQGSVISREVGISSGSHTCEEGWSI